MLLRCGTCNLRFQSLNPRPHFCDHAIDSLQSSGGCSTALFQSGKASLGLGRALQGSVTRRTIFGERLLRVVQLQLELTLIDFVPLQFLAFERQHLFLAGLLLLNPIHLKTELVQPLFRPRKLGFHLLESHTGAMGILLRFVPFIL